MEIQQKSAHISLFPLGTTAPVIYSQILDDEVIPLSAPSSVIQALDDYFKHDEAFIFSREVIPVFVGVKELHLLQKKPYIKAVADCVLFNRLVLFFASEHNLIFLKKILLSVIKEENIYYHHQKEDDKFVTIKALRGKQVKINHPTPECVISLC